MDRNFPRGWQDGARFGQRWAKILVTMVKSSLGHDGGCKVWNIPFPWRIVKILGSRRTWKWKRFSHSMLQPLPKAFLDQQWWRWRMKQLWQKSNQWRLSMYVQVEEVNFTFHKVDSMKWKVLLLFGCFGWLWINAWAGIYGIVKASSSGYWLPRWCWHRGGSLQLLS